MKEKVPIIPRMLLITFMLTTLMAPVTMLNKILFVILMIWTLVIFTKISNYRFRFCISSFIIIAIFFYGLLISLFVRSDSELAVQFFLATFILILVHYIKYFDIDMDQAVEVCGKVMLAATGLYLLVFFNYDLPYASAVFDWFNKISSSATSERDFWDGGVTVTLALGTAPFLFVPWCIVCVRLIRSRHMMDLLWLLFYGLAIGLSGARGLVVIALTFLFFALLWLTSLRVRIFFLLILVAFLLIAIPFVINETKLFSGDEISNAIKMGHLISFLEQLSIYNAFFGNGLGSYYLSSGRNQWLAHTELTPIDLSRYVGIPLAVLVYLLMLFPFARIAIYLGEKFLFVFGFFLFLILSITNPTLINSYGMIVVLWYWTKLHQSIKNSVLVLVKKSSGKNSDHLPGLEG